MPVPDLELAAKRKRLSIVSAMPAAPVINEEEQKKRKQEEKKALALKRGISPHTSFFLSRITLSRLYGRVVVLGVEAR